MTFAPWRTVRGQLLLAALVVEVLMLAILVSNSLRLLHDAMGEQAREQAAQIGPVLSAALVAPLVQYDIATVQAVLDESHAIRGIDYLAVTDVSGTVIATSGWSVDQPLPVVDKEFRLDNAPPRYDVALAIKLAGQPLGTLQFGLDLSRIQVARKNLLFQGILIASGELLLSAALLTLLGLLITRELSLLTAASLKVAQGQLTLEPVPEGQDDVGRLGAAFNVMSQAIAERVEQLTCANQEGARIAQSLQEKNAQLAQNHVQLTTENRMRLKAQKELELALERIQDRTEQLNAIFDLSPDGFVSFDAQGCVKYVSPAFSRMTGMALDETVGLNETEFSARLAQTCLDSARFPGIAFLKTRLNAPKTQSLESFSTAPSERQLIELNHPEKHVLEVGLRISKTNIISQILYFRDVTHETEIDRMKSEFLSHAAHELRTPMVSIFGYTELMLSREFTKDKHQDILGIIHRQSELMIAIINELLDLVRIEERRGKDFFFNHLDVGQLVHQVVSDFGVPAGQIPPILNLPQNICWVRADQKKLMQAVRNIVSNAHKYSPAGGQVVVSLFQQNRSLPEATQAPWVGIRVQDHGMGMTPEQTARIFERFYRADTTGNIPGTGLGMSLVKEIIELHHGSVDIHSAVGVGTTVTLWLPAAETP